MGDFNFLYTIDEYLAGERAADERSEYLDGRIIAVDGESLTHGTILVNCVSEVGLQLKGTPYFTFMKGMRFGSGPTPMTGRGTRGLFSYPDIAVVCGEPEYHDAHRDIILNPKVLVEVLSPTTEAFDRGDKFLRYQRWNPTLTDYVLVSQESAQVEHYCRQADGSWIYRAFIGRDAVVIIDSIHCTLKLADVYDRVRFADEAPTLPDRT